VSQANYWDHKAFGRLCDAVAYRQLIVVTGSGVSVGVPNAATGEQSLPTWSAVLTSLRARFAQRLQGVATELDLLGNAFENGSEYLIEAATLIRETVGVADYREAVVDLTTPFAGARSELHDLIEELDPLGIVTFNYDLGHENSHQVAHHGAGARMHSALYSDDRRLRKVIAGDFESRFLLKAHGCVSRPRSIVLDRASYRDIMSRRLGYRAFVQHVLARFNALIVGFGLNDPDFDDLLQTFDLNFGGGIRDHVYIWKRGQRPDEEARAAVLRRRYGLACIFVDKFEDVRGVIADAKRHAGPRLRKTIDEALVRGRGVAEFRSQRRRAHVELRKLSTAGAGVATRALQQCVQDPSRDSIVRAEAAYSLGKVRPTLPGTTRFLLDQIRADADPEVAIYALAALLQLDSPARLELMAWSESADALRSACDRIDQNLVNGDRGGRARARKYLEALLARWDAAQIGAEELG
jgi:hypothetical protein